ncbi:MAG: hypothetical protein IJ400_05655 [Clostridia bacterium]|nr:hypothetical protein [Clostridia bacterium]
MKKLITLSILLLALGMCLVFSACNGNEEPSEITYTITVKDYKGEVPQKALYIEIFKLVEGAESEFVEMDKLNESGTYQTTLPASEKYEVKLSSADGEISYDKNSCILEKTKANVEIKVYDSSVATTEIWVLTPAENGFTNSEEYDAPIVKEGATMVALDGVSYFVFIPTKGGVYKFSYVADADLSIEYRGSANFVQSQNTTETVDGAFEVEVLDSGIGTSGTGTTSIVVALYGESEDAVLVVERTGDPKPVVPFTDKQAQEVSSDKYTYGLLNYTIKNVDLKDKNLTVIKGSDGFYHIGNEQGPVVLIRIASASPYLGALTEIGSLVCVEEDQDGNVTLKERYNDLISAYANQCDSSGACPLTDELKYVIEKAGAYNGWFEGDRSLFVEHSVDADGNVSSMPMVGIVNANKWLFACCYVEPNTKGTQSSPMSIKTSNDTTNPQNGEVIPATVYTVKLGEGESFYLKGTTRGILTITAGQGITVSFGGTDYTADSTGLIYIEMDTATPEFSITLSGTEEKIVSFTFKDFQ